jgi:hypothetical protein
MISEKSFNHKTKTVFNISFIRKSCNFQKIVTLKIEMDFCAHNWVKFRQNYFMKYTHNWRSQKIYNHFLMTEQLSFFPINIYFKELIIFGQLYHLVLVSVLYCDQRNLSICSQSPYLQTLNRWLFIKKN